MTTVSSKAVDEKLKLFFFPRLLSTELDSADGKLFLNHATSPSRVRRVAKCVIFFVFVFFLKKKQNSDWATYSFAGDPAAIPRR